MSKLGLKKIYGYDIDEDVIEIARENDRSNANETRLIIRYG